MYKNIPDRIVQKYEKMTKAEKRITNYILDHIDSLSLTSISELADSCNVAVSTVFRLCKLLGYGGYQEFKIALAQEQGQTQREETREIANVNSQGNLMSNETVVALGLRLKKQYVAAIDQTLELLAPDNVTKAAQLFHDSQSIYCLGSGVSMIIATEAWGRFIGIGKNFITLQDSHLKLVTASKLTEKDTIWLFSYSGSTKEGLNLLTVAKKRGAKIVVVTRFKNSPIAKLADILLICGANESPIQSGSVIAKIAQLTIIDMVYYEYVRLYQEEFEQNAANGSIENAVYTHL